MPSPRRKSDDPPPAPRVVRGPGDGWRYTDRETGETIGYVEAFTRMSARKFRFKKKAKE